MSECMGRDLLSGIAERVGEVLAVDVLEMYSPERFGEFRGRLGFKQGCSLDLTHGFNFDTAVDRAQAWAIIERDQPLLVIGSPPCTCFSMLNELGTQLHRGHPARLLRFDNNLEKAKRDCRCCCRIYKHPWLAVRRGWTAYGRLRHCRALLGSGLICVNTE